jgi:hypothetical protein
MQVFPLPHEYEAARQAELLKEAGRRRRIVRLRRRPGRPG